MQHSSLAACPFCGARAEIVRPANMKNGTRTYFIDCTECGASVSFTAAGAAKDDAGQAIAAWNRRAAVPDAHACPFCGGQVELEHYEPEDDCSLPEYGLACRECHSYTNFWEAMEAGQDIKAETLRRWTRRSTDR